MTPEESRRLIADAIAGPPRPEDGYATIRGRRMGEETAAFVEALVHKAQGIPLDLVVEITKQYVTARVFSEAKQ